MIIEHDNPGLLALLRIHEGFRARVYKCTSGRLTIGIGHNLDARPLPGISLTSQITVAKAFSILKDDLDDVIHELCKRVKVFQSLDIVRQAVLVDMAFNMGVTGLLRFKEFLAALSTRSWKRASAEMFDSKWAFQVGDGPGKVEDRVDRLAKMIETGAWL